MQKAGANMATAPNCTIYTILSSTDSSLLYVLSYFHGLFVVMSEKVIGLVCFHRLSSVDPEIKDCKRKTEGPTFTLHSTKTENKSGRTRIT